MANEKANQNYIDNLFETIERENMSISRVIEIFNKKFNGDMNDKTDYELKRLCAELKIEIPYSYGMQEDAIRSVVEKFPNNDKENEVLAKVVLINQLYSTHLNSNEPKEPKDRKSAISVIGMARHIVDMNNNKKIDIMIEDGNSEAVDLIGNLANKNYINAFSFASKYCSWHNIVVNEMKGRKNYKEYSIMDSFTKGFISNYYKSEHYKKRVIHEKTDKSDKSELEKSESMEYEIYAKDLGGFRENECPDCKLKEIDSFLWSFEKAKKEKV